MEQRYYHIHQIIQERCKSKLKCVRHCPTKAIRVRDGHVSFAEELCIDCGGCMNSCPEHVFVPISDMIDDFVHFKYQIAIPSPVLYTQFSLDVHPSTVDQALKNIGFDEVADAAAMSYELGFALLHHVKTHSDIRPLVSDYCPTIVRLIQVNYPNLIGNLAPFDVPRELVAKEMKQTYSKKLGLKEEEIGLIYITPCPAKIVSIKQPAEKERSWIDGAISVRDIYNVIVPEILNLQKTNNARIREDFHYGKGWSVLGHISRDVGSVRCLTVAGLDHVKIILDDLEEGKLLNCDFVEAMACMQGCVGGIFCVENPYIARHNSVELEKQHGGRKSLDKENIIRKYEEGFYFLEHPVLPRPTQYFDHDVATSIRRMRQKERIILKLPQKDCCLCGAPDCESFAEDCARGEAELSDCMLLFEGTKH